MPHIAALTIFPFKSLDGVAVEHATVRPSGGLAGDRQFAIVDDRGGFVNGKRYASVHQLRATFSQDRHTIHLEGAGGVSGDQSTPATFDLEQDRTQLEEWLRAYFGFTCRVVRDDLYGFPDDSQAAGPTVISSATLLEVARWFPKLGLEEVRRRFRANIEVGGVEPFWEDRLYGEAGLGVRFRLGSVGFLGTNPCQRCVVPSRDSLTGISQADFSKQFMAHRRDTLPAWAPLSRFDHFYRLATNTRLVDSSDSPCIRVGDSVEIES